MNIFSRPIKGSKINMMRSDVVFKECTVSQYINWIINIEENIKSDPHVKECKVLSRKDDGMPSSLYYRMKLTGMSERDCCMTFEKFDLDDGRIIFITKGFEHPDYPVTSKIIRLDIYSASQVY